MQSKTIALVLVVGLVIATAATVYTQSEFAHKGGGGNDNPGSDSGGTCSGGNYPHCPPSTNSTIFG